MKSHLLLESIGFVDEQLLQEAETAKFVRKKVTFKVVLVAAIIAILSMTAVAVDHFFPGHVSGGEVVPETFHIESLDADWSVVDVRESAGYRLQAQIEVAQDVPMYLQDPYLPTVPPQWKCSGAASAKYDGKIGMVGITWSYTEGGNEYEVFYRQESAYAYKHREDCVVWLMDGIPEDVTVSGEVTMIADASVFMVSVSGSKADRNFYSYGRTLVFWSDGYSIFQLAVPQYWTEDQIYDMMCSMTLQGDMEYAMNHLE